MAKIPHNLKALRTFALVTSIVLFLVLVMGFVVTNTGSAHGCGHSWPLCQGQFIPSVAFHPLIEFSHRALSGIAGILSLVLLIWAWRGAGANPKVRMLAVVGTLFVFVQAVIGAAAVLHPQSPEIMALHFGFSLIAFGASALLAVVLYRSAPVGTARTLPRSFRATAIFSMVYIYGVVYLGAYVSHLDASHACAGWPLCNGAVIPAFHGLVAVVFFHRLAALGSLILFGYLFSLARKLKSTRPDLTLAGHLSLGLIVLQALSGALLVLSNFALGVILLHVSIMALLFAAVSYLFVESLALPDGTVAAAQRAAATSH